MTWEQFWYDDPSTLSIYIRKHRMEQEAKEQIRETEAWLVGAYVYEAVGAVLEQAFSKHSKAQYPRTPHPTPTEYRRTERQRREAEIMASYLQMEAFAKRFNARLDS